VTRQDQPIAAGATALDPLALAAALPLQTDRSPHGVEQGRAEPNVEQYDAALSAIEELACAPAQPSLLLELCVERARALVRASGTAVELLEESEELLFAATSGLLRDLLGMVQSVIGTLCGTAIRSSTVVRSGNAQRDPRGNMEQAQMLGVRSVVTLPLTQDRRQIGTLLVVGEEEDQFTDEDVALLERLARVASARLDYALARDARRRSEEALAASRQKYRTVLGSIDQGILVIDDDGRIGLVNPAAERILGQPAYDLIGKRPGWTIRREDGTEVSEPEWTAQLALRENRAVAEANVQMVRSDGQVRWIDTAASPLPRAEDGRRGAVLCFSDVTDRRLAAERLRRNEQLLAETQRLAHVGSWYWVIGEDKLTWTDEMYRLVGLEPRSVRVTPALYYSLIHPDDRDRVEAMYQEVTQRREAFELTYRVILAGDAVRQLHITGEVEPGPVDGPLRLWGSAQDVTERLQVQERLREMALTDPLTGLGNRLMLIERLRDAVASLRTIRVPVAIIAIDLDGLKAINDSYGHAIGDELLQETGRRLRALVREPDLVARLGGDEFVLLCLDIGPDGAIRLAERVVAELAAPYQLADGVTAWAGASVGVAVTDDPSTDVDRLLAQADRALYRAKTEGGNRYALDPSGISPLAGR
jgi:diguanylate cyclase (GGDEF)-like protein/PAS domain S-box-containing protein